MASMVFMGALSGTQLPWYGDLDQIGFFRNTGSGKRVIIAKGNIIEGIEAKA